MTAAETGTADKLRSVSNFVGILTVADVVEHEHPDQVLEY